MDRADTLKIMATLTAAYPNFYKGMQKEDSDGIVKLWTLMFSDEPYQIVEAAVVRLISSDTKGFPPVIGQVKEQIYRLKTPNEMTEYQAFDLVKKAVRKYCPYDKPEDNPFFSLPVNIQHTLGSPSQIRDFAMMDLEAFESVAGSNFMRSYRAKAAGIREFEKLPSDIKQISLQLAERLSDEQRLLGGHNDDISD